MREKSNTLLEQYRDNNYIDSVVAYDKIKNIADGKGDEKSYKQLVKSASGLLPEGSAKKFITGLTNLDAGIINKRISSYTLNGQTIKGVDVGYDLGFCETGFTYGRIEYVGRDGTVDKYSGYSARANFKPTKKQTATVTYFGYMPSKKMLNETDFFKDVDVTMPSFKQPVNIVSLAYGGTLSKTFHFETEGATSFRSVHDYNKENTHIADKSSWKFLIDGIIPNTNLNVQANYEHVGKQFENNTLPLNLSGTDKYTATVKNTFFKSFLAVGVEYNYLIQQNFSNRSASSKWGFDISTHSKQYPSISLSYKPFATFRSYSDTLNIPQRPILGAVWLGKVSYQIKKKGYVLRLTGIYNKNTALVDTTATNSNLVQLNFLYTRGKINLMMNVGQMGMNATQVSSVHQKTNYMTFSGGYQLNAQWMVNAGQDIGFTSYGLSRYAATMGWSYRFKNTPLMIRVNMRYNTYKLAETQSWKTLYSGMLDINWSFKFKMNEKDS